MVNKGCEDGRQYLNAAGTGKGAYDLVVVTKDNNRQSHALQGSIIGPGTRGNVVADHSSVFDFWVLEISDTKGIHRWCFASK